MNPADARSWLQRLAEGSQRDFDEQRRVLSFGEYLELVARNPRRHSRDAARYMLDCFEYYGSYEVERPWGKVRRWRLFDQPFASGAGGPERWTRHVSLIGQEAVQDAIYVALRAFAREGRANRLLLLHGPNGSAKSTLTACLIRALEHFSTTEEGALYRFSWVFPKGGGSGIGFSAARETEVDSYAHLPEDRIEVKLSCSLRQHPLLLLPLPERRQLLQRLYERAPIEEPPPALLWEGELAPYDRQVFEALMTAYRGELRRVLAHVQVERVFVSRRQRVGAVVIGPQMHVDARERVVGWERSMGAVPPSLGAVRLLEPYGETGAAGHQQRRSLARLRGPPRVPVLPGPPQARPRALPARLRAGAAHLRHPGRRAPPDPRGPPRHLRGRPVGRADAAAPVRGQALREPRAGPRRRFADPLGEG